MFLVIPFLLQYITLHDIPPAEQSEAAIFWDSPEKGLEMSVSVNRRSDLLKSADFLRAANAHGTGSPQPPTGTPHATEKISRDATHYGSANASHLFGPQLRQ